MRPKTIPTNQREKAPPGKRTGREKFFNTEAKEGREWAMSRMRNGYLSAVLFMTGCAGANQEIKRDLDLMSQKAAEVQEQEVSGVPRFSKSAISDADMLQGRAAQEYRDNVIP
ncbi:MAG: hypothetical protein ACKO0V_16785 [bacterium]